MAEWLRARRIFRKAGHGERRDNIKTAGKRDGAAKRCEVPSSYTPYLYHAPTFSTFYRTQRTYRLRGFFVLSSSPRAKGSFRLPTRFVLLQKTPDPPTPRSCSGKRGEGRKNAGYPEDDRWKELCGCFVSTQPMMNERAIEKIRATDGGHAVVLWGVLFSDWGKPPEAGGAMHTTNET